MPFLFLLFLLIPLVEIWFLIKVGSVVGAGWTIFLVVATAVIGAGLVRAQGLSAISRIQRELAAGGLPAAELLQGIFLLVSGALLLTPGFFTDAIGFALLVPGIRQLLARRLFAGGTAFGFRANHPQPGAKSAKEALDAEYRRED